MSDAKNYMESLPKDDPTVLSTKPEDLGTKVDDMKALKDNAHKKLREAQSAWHQYWTACEVGSERIRGAETYDCLMRATRGG